MTQVLALWLDGFDMRLAEQWRLPTLTRLTSSSAHARLNSGGTHLTGLTGEHLATGLDPIAAQRAGAVHFDPITYACSQLGAVHPTAFGGVPSVVFDPCYFDLAGAPPPVRGLVDWGAHDPGGPATARPGDLHDEVSERFGAYPAKKWIYAAPWVSTEDCAQMGSDLVQAVESRAQIATWLLGERLPGWQLAFVGVSEAHSATEGLYHGADPAHPLHSEPSGPVAGKAIRDVYEAIDRLVADLIDRFPEAIHVVFSMHGMGINSSDVPSMLLLGELMRRWAGDATPDVDWPTNEAGVPLLAPTESWGLAVRRSLTPTESWGRALRRSLATAPRHAVRIALPIARQLPEPVRRALRPALQMCGRSKPSVSLRDGERSLAWMPVMRHAPFWKSMRAFALPAFYDGRVRVNLQGREAHGTVSAAQYIEVLDELESLLRACHDPVSGEPAVAHIERPLRNPLAAGPTEADLIVTWAGMTLGLTHPLLGTIGPFPLNRTGSHTSPWGACFIHGVGIAPSDLGVHSSFDVLPTLFDLAGSPAPWKLSGEPIHIHRPSSSPVGRAP